MTRTVLFIRSLQLAAVLFTVAACSHGKCVKNGAIGEISGNHGHSLNVPAAQVKAGVGGAYTLTGGDHQHTIMLTDADMKKLAQDEPVVTRATSIQGHTHEVHVSCRD